MINQRFSLFLGLLFLSSGYVRTGVLSGRVADELSQPVYGVRITLDGVCGVLTDTAGQFTLETIASGRHLLVTEFDGYESSADSVSVIADDTVQVILDLWPVASREERDKHATMIRNLLTLSGHERNTHPIGINRC